MPRLHGDQELGLQAANHVSQPIAIRWLDSSRVGVVTVDPGRMSPRYRGDAYASVVDVEHRKACVDGALDVPLDPAPVVGFRGDTLVVLYQDVGADGGAETIVKRFRLDLSPCRWEVTDHDAR